MIGGAVDIYRNLLAPAAFSNYPNGGKHLAIVIRYLAGVDGQRVFLVIEPAEHGVKDASAV